MINWMYECISYYVNTFTFEITDNSRIRPQERIVRLGYPVSFICHSRTKVKWTFNNGSLPKYIRVMNDISIVIKTVAVWNRGYYECEGSLDYNRKEIFYATSTLAVVGEYYIYSFIFATFWSTPTSTAL